MLIDGLMQHGSDYTPYERMEVAGWPVKTPLRGKVVADEGKIVSEKGYGQFPPREIRRA